MAVLSQLLRRAQTPGLSRALLSCAPLMVLLCLPATAQEYSRTYLLRLDHETSNGTACVLLGNDGGFHYEADDFDKVKVYEGTLTSSQLASVRQDSQLLSRISQADIEEPLIRGSRNLLYIHVFPDEGTKELLFRSSESQQPFAKVLNPLLTWMAGLPKLSQRELSEDAGNQNCLPRGKLTLKRRGEISPQPPLARRPAAGGRIAPSPSAPQPPAVQPLVALDMTEKTSSVMRQTCALVGSNGQYRFEYRSQRVGKKEVVNQIARGQITSEDLARLRELLDAPTLVRLRHREPPSGVPLNIMGSVLEFLISRPSGLQDLILTDSRHRSTFFYPGDGDISVADPVLKFTQEKLQPGAVTVPARQLNACSALP